MLELPYPGTEFLSNWFLNCLNQSGRRGYHKREVYEKKLEKIRIRQENFIANMEQSQVLVKQENKVVKRHPRSARVRYNSPWGEYHVPYSDDDYYNDYFTDEFEDYDEYYN